MALLVATSVSVDTAVTGPAAVSTSLPASFEANHGQADAAVKFLARFAQYRLFLTASEVVLVAPDSAPVRMSLVGMKKAPAVAGEDPLPGKTHYLLGRRDQWRTDIPTFGKIRYSDVYPGIDLVYYGTDRKLEYDFHVAPGADPAQIEMRFSGMTSLALEASGDLTLVVSSSATFTLEKPRLYQMVGGTQREIQGSYRRVGIDRIRFEVGEYDRRLPLVIDPILAYSTYLGTSSTDGVAGLALDPQGNIVVIGQTFSTSFPVTPDAFQSSPSDVFVTKLNASGTAIVYSTYFGGTGTEIPVAIAVDSIGNTYLTGYTYSSNLPVANAIQPNFVTSFCGNEFGGLCPDAFATKLNAAGSGLVYSTYLGGHGWDSGHGLEVDSTGSLYLTGMTYSSDFPTLNSLFPRMGFSGDFDAFLTKIDPLGALLYSTYLSGSGSDRGFDVAVDAFHNVYVVGDTTSNNFPVVNPIQATNVNFGEDAFVMKVNAAGTGLIYSTYLGGNESDTGYGIAVDADANAYVTGLTRSTNFPTASPVQPALRGVNDVFVAKLNSAGSALVYSTYLGGNDREEAMSAAFDFLVRPIRPVSITVSSDGETYVSGHTSSSDFPSSTPFGGGVCTPFPIIFPDIPCPDAFITVFGPQSSQIGFSRLLGGSHDDRSRAVAVGPDGSIHVGGTTSSMNFPTVAPLQPTNAGGTDGFITRIARDTCTLVPPTDLVATPGSSPLRPTFSWQGVPGAEGYLAVMSPVAELVLTGSPSLQFVGVSASTSLVPQADLNAGDYAWMVMAWSSACGLGARSQSQPLTLLPGCPTAPTLVSPLNVEVTDTVRFVWTPSAGASLYKLTLFHAFSGNFAEQHFSATNELTLTDFVLGGDYRWVVSAFNSSCGPANSAPGAFRR